MATKIYDVTRGSFVDSSPQVYHAGRFKPVSAWVFKNNLWRKSYDPREVNLISNSRMISGTDIYMSDGAKLGFSPPTWSIFFNTTKNASALFDHDDDTYSRRYTLATVGGRVVMSTRVSCVENQIYYASFKVDDIKTLPRDAIANINIDGVNSTNINQYIEILEPFDVSTIGEDRRIGCKFLIKRDCIGVLNVGVGVLSNDTGEFTFSEPQINRNPFFVDYVATPVLLDYHAVDFESGYIQNSNPIITEDGYHWIDYSITIKEHQELMLLNRVNNDLYTGISINTATNKLRFTKDNALILEKDLNEPLPIDQLFRLSLQIDVSGNFISRVSVLINNVKTCEVNDYLIGFTNNNNHVIGNSFKPCNVVLEQFNLYTNKNTFSFTMEEGSEDLIYDKSGKEIYQLGGSFVWINKL